MEQLRKYYDSEANIGARETPKACTSGGVRSPVEDNDKEVEYLPLTIYGGNCDFTEDYENSQVVDNNYENFRTFSSDEDEVEIHEESDKRHRKAPERLGQWVRAVYIENMAVNMGTSEEEGAHALLDLRYGGRDATVRLITPAKYPCMERMDTEPVVDASFGVTNGILQRTLQRTLE
eukprot:GHVU01013917.1.p1 GENE.GHVU01013917.1~~GHVU01013917.1.p1  ORF type:complete len:177 (-),score=18.40 GHVU01013917.1:433-963(-)